MKAALQQAQRARRSFLKPRMSVWLSGALARPFECPQVSGLKSWNEARAFAERLAPEAVGFDEACLVSLDSWPGDGAARAAAVPAKYFDLAQQLSKEFGVAVFSLRPAWSRALDQLHRIDKSANALAIVELDAITLIGQDTFGRLLLKTQLLMQPNAANRFAGLARLRLAHGLGEDGLRCATLRALNPDMGHMMFDISLSEGRT